MLSSPPTVEGCLESQGRLSSSFSGPAQRARITRDSYQRFLTKNRQITVNIVNFFLLSVELLQYLGRNSIISENKTATLSFQLRLDFLSGKFEMAQPHTAIHIQDRLGGDPVMNTAQPGGNIARMATNAVAKARCMPQTLFFVLKASQ